MFEFWNNLPKELRLDCIKWMDLKTRYKLHSASHTERNLVSNSERINFHEITFRFPFYSDGISVFIRHKWQMSVNEFARFTREDNQRDSAISFLSFVFQNCTFSKVNFMDRDEHLGFLLSKIGPERTYNMKELHASAPVPLSFLQNCVPNSIQNVWLSYTRVCGKPFPVEEFLSTPALQMTKKWRLNLHDCPDLGVAIAKKWMEWDVDCKSRLEFYYEDHKKVVPSFLKRFGTVKIVQQTPTMVRFETPNPEKHMILQMSCEFILAMIAADLEEKDFKKYIFSP